MARLSPRLPFAADETPLSWAARMAAFHTGGRLAPFLNDFGIGLPDLIMGATEAVTRLCDIADQDARPVLHNTIRSTRERRLHLRGEAFSAEMTIGPETRFCPACLAEDETGDLPPHALRRGRLIWRLRTVRVCPVHHRPLIPRRRGKWDDVAHELPVLVPESREELLALTEIAAHHRPSPLQDYVLARLEGLPGPAWADGQGIEQAARAAEMLGAVMQFGVEALPAQLSDEDWDRAGAAGWEFLREGEEGASAALSALQQRALDRGVVGHRSRCVTFGMLYRWLSYPKITKNPGPIRDLLRQHIIDRMDTSPGEILLGKAVITPRLGSITSIAKCNMVHPLALRDVLISRRVIPPEAKDQPCSTILLDFQTGKEAALDMRRAVAVTALPRILNASRPIVECLIATGLIAPLHGDGEKQGKVSGAIDGLRVEALIAQINRDFARVDAPPDGMVKLAKAAEINHVPMEFILVGVFRRHLERVVRLQSEPGLGGLLVDPQEVKSLPSLIPEVMPFIL